MNKGDEKIDKLFRDAFSEQEHEFDPAFWPGAEELLLAGKTSTGAFFSKSTIIISSVVILIAAGLLYLNGNSVNEIVNSDSQQSDTPNKKQTSNSAPQTVQSALLVPLESIERSYILVGNKNVTEKKNQFKSETLDRKTPTAKSSFITSNSMTANLATVNQIVGKEQDSSPNFTPAKVTHINLPKPIAATGNPAISGDNFFTGKDKKANDNHISQAPELGLTTEVFDESFPLQALHSGKLQLLNEPRNTRLPQLKSGSKHKPTSSPLTLRLSVGKMLSPSRMNQKAIINTSAQLQGLEGSLEYHFLPNWGIQLGVGLSQQTIQQNHTGTQITDTNYWDYNSNEIMVNDSTWWLGGWYFYDPFKVTVIDSTLLNQTDTTEIVNHTELKIKLIEIPLLVTYNFGYERWSFQLATGINFGIFRNSSGQFIGQDNPMEPHIPQPELFNNIQYSYIFQGEAAYTLHTNWMVSVRPQLKMNLNSLYQEPTQYKYTYLGIHAGLVYRW